MNALLCALVVQAAVRKAVQAPDDVDAANAESAAHVAVQAAKVSNQVASHAQNMHVHAQEALKHAQGALKTARTDTEGLTEAQHESLQKADAELEAATKKLETEELAETEWVQETLADAAAEEQAHATTEHLRADLEDLQGKVASAQDAATKAQLEAELESLRKQLEAQQQAEARKQGYLESLGKMKDEVARMQQHIDTMEDIKKLRMKIGDSVPPSDEEASLRKELEELKDLLQSLEGQHAAGQTVTMEAEDSLRDELAHLRKGLAESIQHQEEMMQEAAAKKIGPVDFAPVGPGARPAPVHMSASAPAGKSVDIDTEMPYGELEPFGREDTAAELTAASIAESDKMVDQIEKAEVAEEKRSVFRALTRLRGAAITSYDGVARSQTGNIDEYNHVHKWRESHPLHHLADEESDVSHWAFPDNAD